MVVSVPLRVPVVRSWRIRPFFSRLLEPWRPPRMAERRAMAFAFGDEWALFLGFTRSLHNLMKRELDTPMADLHAPVDQFLNDDPLPPNRVVYLIKRPVILDRMVILEAPFRLDAEHGIEVNGDRAVKVFFLLGHYRKALVIDREIRDEKFIGFLYRAHPFKPHLFDEAVLEGVEEALDSSLGLGRVGMELSDVQLL